MLLLVLGSQLIAPVAAVAVCADDCAEGEASDECPPLCDVCPACTQSQRAIVTSPDPDVPQPVSTRATEVATVRPALQLAADILHVPLSA